MPLNRLYPNSNDPVSIQQTDLSIDVLGRFSCNTLEEALSSGHFDVIVIGSGMYGGYTAAKLWAEKPHLRILLLEAGPFLISEHVQNLSRIGYEIFPPVSGQPYVAPHEHAAVSHYYCVGGKSLGWGKWSPQLTEADLQNWPTEAANYLRENYDRVEREIGVTPREDFIYGDLADKFGALINSVLAANPIFNDLSSDIAPIAAQSKAPSSGLYSFDAFSSVITLIDAVRGDIAEAGPVNNQARRLMLVPRVRAFGMRFTGNQVSAIQLVHGRDQTYAEIPVSPQTRVLLGLGSMETTRLVLNSIPQGPSRGLVGRNLMAHLRSNFNVRVHRSELGLELGTSLPPAAFHVQGDSNGRRYHFQVLVAADNTHRVESILYRMVPDFDSLKAMLAAQKSDWITVRILTVGEMKGFPNQPIYTPDTYWCDLSPFEFDIVAGQTVPKLYAHWMLRAEDVTFWNEMDGQAVQFAQALVDDPSKIEFQQADGQWTTNPRPAGSFRDSLGSTFHESGTLWMGDDPAHSVTNVNGRFHEFQNLYALDQSIFPAVGSANPVLTGLTICRKIVEGI